MSSVVFPPAHLVVNSSSYGGVPSLSSDEVGEHVSDDSIYDSNVVASEIHETYSAKWDCDPSQSKADSDAAMFELDGTGIFLSACS